MWDFAVSGLIKKTLESDQPFHQNQDQLEHITNLFFLLNQCAHDTFMVYYRTPPFFA